MAQLTNTGNSLSLFYHWSLGLSLDPFAENREQNRILLDLIFMTQVPNILRRSRRTQETQTPIVEETPEETPQPEEEEEEEETETSTSEQSQTLISIAQETEFRSYIRMIENIFLTILILLKLLYEYKLGALMLIASTLLCQLANKVITSQVSHRGNVNSQMLMQILTGFFINLIIIFIGYQSLGLHYSLIFLPIEEHQTTLWSMIWCIIITDFVLKIIAMTAKIMCLLIPVRIIAHRFKERFFIIVEEVSQLHRCLATITPWMGLLMSMCLSEKFTDKVVGCLLVVLYLPLKVLVLLLKYADLAIAVNHVTTAKPLWFTPTPDQMAESDGICPICFESFNDAVILMCNHIFCTLCISQWFEHERTCPICRYPVTKELKWRDGSTLLTIEVF